ncbi:MAG: hypothetical protein ACI90V_005250 [Bacillariaceae sp.]|jgi:hypothetical protein
MVFREKILRENFETKSKDFSPNKYELSKKCQVHNTTQHNTTHKTQHATRIPSTSIQLCSFEEFSYGKEWKKHNNNNNAL